MDTKRINDLILHLKHETAILHERKTHSGFVDFQTSIEKIQDITNLLKYETDDFNETPLNDGFLEIEIDDLL